MLLFGGLTQEDGEAVYFNDVWSLNMSFARVDPTRSIGLRAAFQGLSLRDLAHSVPSRLRGRRVPGPVSTSDSSQHELPANRSEEAAVVAVVPVIAHPESGRVQTSLKSWMLFSPPNRITR